MDCNKGARIEHIKDRLLSTGEKPGSSLVMLVGTNNLMKDGSEKILDKYEELINEAKLFGYKTIILTNILERKDLDNF